MAGQMLTPKQMQEVKSHEVAINAQQKREGTKHPIHHVIWGCGCCYGPSLMMHRTILTAEEGAKYMQFRKSMDRLNQRKNSLPFPVYQRLVRELKDNYGMSESVEYQQYSHNH